MNIIYVIFLESFWYFSCMLLILLQSYISFGSSFCFFVIIFCSWWYMNVKIACSLLLVQWDGQLSVFYRIEHIMFKALHVPSRNIQWVQSHSITKILAMNAKFKWLHFHMDINFWKTWWKSYYHIFNQYGLWKSHITNKFNGSRIFLHCPNAVWMNKKITNNNKWIRMRKKIKIKSKFHRQFFIKCSKYLYVK